MDIIFNIYRDIWPEFYPKVINFGSDCKSFVPCIGWSWKYHDVFDEKVFSLKMAKFQISVFFQSDVCSHEKISV